MQIIDIHDRHNSGNACAVCCCEPIGLRAGELRLITLNYAAWTVPIMANGGPGLIPTPQISIEENTDSCHNDAIDGFAAPTTLGEYFVTNQDLAVNTALTFDLKTDVAPSGNTFEFRLHPVSGPSYGTLTTPLDGASWVYTPSNGFTGYDQFWVEITDAQGRAIIRPVNINVGGASGIPPIWWGENRSMGAQVDRTKMRINSAQQTVSLPIYLPPSNGKDTIDSCRRYRATVKVFARDCDNEYSHITCLDVFTAGC